MTSTTHIAGPQVTIGMRVRQRCAWCGAIISDIDLTMVSVPTADLDENGGWKPGRWDGLVRITERFPQAFEKVEDNGLTPPEDACGHIDDEVTA
jgi:hypothetical protein